MSSTGPWGPPRESSPSPWRGADGTGPWRPSQPQWPATTPGGWANPPATRPPTRSHTLARVVVVVVVLLIIAPTISGWLNQLNQSPAGAGAPPPVSAPSSRVNVPTTATATSTSPSTSTGSTGSVYVPGAPDLTPDEPPMPTTYAEVDQMLKANPLYFHDLVPTACSITDIDLTSASVPDIERHLNGFVDCLMAAWHPPVTAADFELPHPSVTVYTRETTSACGTLPMENAVYCSADQQIYFARDLIDAFPRNLQTMRFMAESVLAHEFGHTIQYRTMILISETVLQQDATTKSGENDYSRRLEMQADCFAGLFLNSISSSAGLTTADRDNVTSLYASLGGTQPYSDDHGTGPNRAAWLVTGLTSTAPGSCSTFTAPASSVS